MLVRNHSWYGFIVAMIMVSIAPKMYYPFPIPGEYVTTRHTWEQYPLPQLRAEWGRLGNPGTGTSLLMPLMPILTLGNP